MSCADVETGKNRLISEDPEGLKNLQMKCEGLEGEGMGEEQRVHSLLGEII